MQSTAKNAHDVFWTIFMSTVAIWLVNNAFIPVVSAIKNAYDSDEPEDYRQEEYIKEFVTQLTGGIPFISPAIDATVAKAADNIKEARGLIPDKRWKRYAADMSPAGVDALERYINGTANSNPEMLFEALMIAAGIPYGNIKRIVVGGKAIAEGGIEEAGRMLWSERQLREETVFDSMAKRFYKPRPKSDDFERYTEWYGGLDSGQKRVFQRYSQEWYRKNIIEKGQ
jgi:hypothetical protein